MSEMGAGTSIDADGNWFPYLPDSLAVLSTAIKRTPARRGGVWLGNLMEADV
jgi:hypothetical protein